MRVVATITPTVSFHPSFDKPASNPVGSVDGAEDLAMADGWMFLSRLAVAP